MLSFFVPENKEDFNRMECATEKKRFGTKEMVRISLLGLLGFMLLMLNFPIPLIPSFLELDIANLPGIIAALTMGPLAGVAVEFVKNLLKIVISTQTVGVGEISNFICGVSLIVPLGIIYAKTKSLKGYILGGAVGIITLCAVASLSNYYFIIPAYAVVFGGMDAIIGLASSVNASVTDLSGLIVLSVIPFNIIKGLVNVALGYVLYKFLRPLFN
jgi:riboflavin transporter FmnP